MIDSPACLEHPDRSGTPCARCGTFRCSECLAEGLCPLCRGDPPLRPTLSFTVAWTVVALLAFLSLGFTAQLAHLAWGIWFSEIIVFAGLAVIGFQLIGFRPLHAMGLQRFDARAFGVGFVFGVVNYVAWAVPLMAAAQAIFPKSMLERSDMSHVFERATPVELAIVLLGVTIAAPLAEEMVFRGFFQRGLELHRGAPRAIVVSALVFSAFHLDLVGLTLRFELGVLFGLLAWRARSVWPAIAAHAAFNFMSSLIFLAGGEAEPEAALDWRGPVLMLVVGNVLLFAWVKFAWDRLPAKEPMAWVEEPPRLPSRLFLPWALAGLAAIALLLVVDLRGVQLNLIDVKLHPTKEIREREDVKELRARARRGEVEFSEYEAKVKSLK